MKIVQTVKHKFQIFKGWCIERVGRVTRNSRLRREGKAVRVSGKLKQSGDKAKNIVT